MNRKILIYNGFLIILLVTFSNTLLSQESKILSEREQVFEFVRQAKMSIAEHKFEDALDFYDKALHHRDVQSNVLLTAAIHNLKGLAFELDGQFQEALAQFEQGMGLLSNRGDEKVKNILESILNRLGGMRKGYIGSPGAAMSIDLYRGEIENLKIFLDREQARVQQELAMLLMMNDANMYLQQNQFEQADSIYIKALQFAWKTRFTLRVQQLFSNLTWSGIKRDQFDQADAWLDSLKKFSPSALSSVELRNARLARGLINRKQKQYPQAIADINQAISFYQQAEDKRGLCRALSHLANTYLLNDDFENARINYLKALELNQSVKDKEAAWFANGGLAKCYYELKNYEAALEHFAAYFDVIREIEGSFYRDEGKTSFLESQNEMTDAYITTTIKVAQQKQQFSIARPIIEQQRAQTLVALQRAGGARGFREAGHLSVERVLFHNRQQEWSEVLNELRAVGFLQGNMMENSVVQRAPGVESMPGPIRDFKEFPLRDNELLPISEIPKVTFLEYYILPDQIITFVKSPDEKIDGAVTKINADSLEKLIADYCFKLEVGDTRGIQISRNVVPIGRRSTRRSVSELSDLLYQLLIQPVTKFLPNDPQQPIVIVPHRSLWQLPFAALQDANKNYFGDRHALTYAASNESWNLIAQKRRKSDHRNPNAWIVGNPRMPEKIEACWSTLSFHSLPGAEIEAREIAGLFGPKNANVFTGSQADRLRLEAWHPNFSVLHFATHGFACPDKALSSFIVLSSQEANDLKVDTTSLEVSLAHDPRFAVKLDMLQEMIDYTWAWWDLSRTTFPGILNAETIIEEYTLNADLVTLSACQTGLGKYLSQGNIGFSRAFLRAGARSLLVSLWRVDDEATKELMIAFYTDYLKHGNKAIALQKAMQQTRRRFPHPKFWAAFSLIGMAE